MLTQSPLPRLTTFDANGFLSAFRQGETDGLARQERENRRRIGDVANNDGFLAGSREALASGDMDWATRLSQMDTQRQAQINDTLGRLASAADTPDRWNTLIAQMRMRFGPESIQGFEDFSSRPQAIRISMTAAENLAEQHRQAQLAETRRLHTAQINHMTTQDAAIGETQELRRRQMDAQNLSRDRGFTLQSLSALSRARTPEEFQLVAQSLRPMLGRMPRFEERDRILQSAMDSLEEFDMGTDEQGRPQRISRGWSPMVLAALGPQGAGNPQGQPQPAPQGGPVAAAGATSGGVAGLRAMIPQNPNGIAPNPAAANLDNGALSQFLPGARPPARPQPGPDTFMPSAGAPAPAAPAPQAAPAAPQPFGGIAQPVAAPGGIPPPVVGSPGAAVPVQGAPAGGGGPQRGYRGPLGARREIVEEIEQQYGAPATWGQGGNQRPPDSVMQRYWQAFHGRSPDRGRMFSPDGASVPIPTRGGEGGGGSGGTGASANARRLIPDILNRLEITGSYLQTTSIPGQVVDQYGGPVSQWLGGGRFQQAMNDYGEATRVIMHALSGATTTLREFDHYVEMFTPRATDTAEVRLLKHNRITGALRTLLGVNEQYTDSNLNDFRHYLRRNIQDYYGISDAELSRLRGRFAQGQASGAPAPQNGPNAPPSNTSGWGSAGSMSTQDILNGLRR